MAGGGGRTDTRGILHPTNFVSTASPTVCVYLQVRDKELKELLGDARFYSVTYRQVSDCDGGGWWAVGGVDGGGSSGGGHKCVRRAGWQLVAAAAAAGGGLGLAATDGCL